jgi:plastocyanin
MKLPSRCGRLCAALVLAMCCAPTVCAAADAAPSDAAAKAPVRVAITAGSYFFKPARISAKVGQPVELTIVKEPGVTPHNFVLHAPEAGIMVDQELGAEPVHVTFTPKAAGKFAFYCSNKLLFFASHRERGMEGVLEVVE